jgi:excisionase family DNA binding protein
MEKTTSAQRIRVLQAEGRRTREIAEELGCSRQYVHQVLRGKSRPRPNENAGLPVHEHLLTVTQAARVLGVTGNTVRRWTEHGLLDSYRIGPRMDRRFNRADVIEYLEGCRRDGAPI